MSTILHAAAERVSASLSFARTRAELARVVLRVRVLSESDRPWVRSLVEREWGLPVVTPTGAYDRPETHEGLVTEIDGERAGVITYVRQGAHWEIVTLIATVEGAGVGRALLEQMRSLARSAGATRLWLITTDDTGAAPFYEHMGMARRRTIENWVDVVRLAKPSTGGYRDAYEFEWHLGKE